MNWNEVEEMQAEAGARYGDPRRCPRHGVAISSGDGMFDGLCGACEAAMDAEADADWAEGMAAEAEDVAAEALAEAMREEAAEVAAEAARERIAEDEIEF